MPPEKKPFDRLHLVPVRYGQILSSTIFAKDYFKERLHAFIDNLNTLYVAFTRSKEELIVFSPRPRKINKEGKVEKITSIADLLWEGWRRRSRMIPLKGANGGIQLRVERQKIPWRKSP